MPHFPAPRAHHLPQHRTGFLPSPLAVGRRTCKCVKRHPSCLDRCAAHVPSFVLRPACSSSPRGRDPAPPPARRAAPPRRFAAHRGATPSPPSVPPLPSSTKSRGKNHTSQKGNLRPWIVYHIRPRAHLESVLGRVVSPRRRRCPRGCGRVGGATTRLHRHSGWYLRTSLIYRTSRIGVETKGKGWSGRDEWRLRRERVEGGEEE
jgi:hypothetical protein